MEVRQKNKASSEQRAKELALEITVLCSDSYAL